MNQITSQLLEACSRSRSKEASISAVNAIKNQKPNTTLEIHSDKNRKLLQTRAPEKDRELRLFFRKEAAAPCSRGRQEWSRRVAEEFFLQGDRERQQGRAPSALNDRETVHHPQLSMYCHTQTICNFM